MRVVSHVVYQIRLFFVALQFFTRLPVPGWVGFESAWLQHASRYFPAVGVVVGMLAAAVYLLAAAVLPHQLAVLLSTAAGIYLTGAFHEDGFADTCDGMGGGSTRERVLEIMSDSRIGAYGAIGIGLLLATKLVTLAALPPDLVVVVLLVGHPLSRLAAVTLVWRLPYAKPAGKAKPVAQGMDNGEYAIAFGSVAVVSSLACFGGWMDGAELVAGVLAGAIVTAWLARKFMRRIGGYTGDCLGAVQQVAEVVFYIAVLAMTS